MAHNSEYPAALAQINAVLCDSDRYAAAERFIVAGHEVIVFRSKNPLFKPFFAADYASDILTTVKPTAESARAYAVLNELLPLGKRPKVYTAAAPKAADWKDPDLEPLSGFIPVSETNPGIRKGSINIFVAKSR